MCFQFQFTVFKKTPSTTLNLCDQKLTKSDLLDTIITKFEVRDVHFPTSKSLDDSDTMNKCLDYSAIYIVFYTDIANFKSHAMIFTCDRANETVYCCIEKFSVNFINKELETLVAGICPTYHICIGDFQLH